MKIEKSLVTQIKVSDLENLDPITIIVEAIAEGKASVTVKCYDKSWTSYWGAMGGNVKEFFTRCNVHYLVDCFDRGIRSQSENIDHQTMEDTFHKKIKQLILEKRKDTYLTKQEAKSLWDEIDIVDFQSIIPEHDHECFRWKLDHYTMNHSVWKSLFTYEDDIFGKSEDFQFWLWENIPFSYEPNYDYKYLCRIVEVVKKVLSEEK